MRALYFVSGIALGLFMAFGCASTFPYRYFGTDMPASCYDQGTMLGKQGKDGWPDLPLSECKPDQKVRLKCMTMLVDEFYSLKSDDEKCHADLINCQKGPRP